MRLFICCFVVLLGAAPSRAQQQGSTPLNLPISLDKIREGLSQPPPAEPLKGLAPGEQPTFRVSVSEQQRFENMLAKIKWDPPGPQVAGGIYAYEQYERAFPRINNPLAQPYGAFTTGQVATLAVEALIEKYVAERVGKVFGTALKEQAEREAREEVARSLAAYRASQTAPASDTPAAPQPKE